MNNEYIEGYLNGLMHISSSISNYIGPSYIEVYCYEKEELLKKYNISPTDELLENKLNGWLGDKKLIESLLYYINNILKETTKVYEVNNEIDIDYTPFTFIEDAFVLETKEYMILFVLGNNE